MNLHKTISPAQDIQFTDGGILISNILEENSNKISIKIYSPDFSTILFEKVIKRASFNFCDKLLLYKPEDRYVILNVYSGEFRDLPKPRSGEMKQFRYLKNSGKYAIVSEGIFDLRNQKLSDPLIEYYDLLDKKWENNFSGTVMIEKEDLLLLYHINEQKKWNKNLLSRIDHNDGKILWTFNIEKHKSEFKSNSPYDRKIELRSIIGNYKDQVWVALTNGDLLCINYNDGQLLKYLRDVPQNTNFGATPDGKYPIIPNPIAAKITHDLGKMICFWKWYYWEIDLKTYEIDFQYIKEIADKNEFMNVSTINGVTVKNNQILSVDHKRNKIAAFNREQRRFDWAIDLPNGISNGRKIGQYRDLVFVKTGNEVHIYKEKESSS